MTDCSKAELMKTLVCKTDPKRPSSKVIEAAAERILEGKLVVFPTETVYGIGANAFDERACGEIYRVKGRASDNPLIVHVYSIEDALKLGRFSREHAEALSKIWPCPLTVIVNGRGKLPETVTAGLDSVAIRCPKGRVIRSIIKKAGVPIAAPSANISTKPSSTKGEHAIGYFRGKVSMIIDGGEADYGIESTILDLRSFRILRPGAFTQEQITKAFGRKPIIGRLAEGTASAKRVISPGTKYRHYAPSTPLFVYTGDRRAVCSILRPFGKSAAFIGSVESCRMFKGTGVRCISLGTSKSVRIRVHSLFDKLIELDSLGVRFAVIEQFNGKGLGYAAMNRIRKASSHKSFSGSDGLKRLIDNI